MITSLRHNKILSPKNLTFENLNLMPVENWRVPPRFARAVCSRAQLQSLNALHLTTNETQNHGGSLGPLQYIKICPALAPKRKCFNSDRIAGIFCTFQGRLKVVVSFRSHNLFPPLFMLQRVFYSIVFTAIELNNTI